MALKDNAGLVKKYAMVDIQSYQNVAVGDTVADTQKSYLSLIAANGTVANTSSVSDSALEATGVIKTIATAVIEGNSHFYVTLEGDSKIYDFALPGMIEIVQYAQGDTVTFKYVEGDPTCSAQSIEAAKSAKGELGRCRWRLFGRHRQGRAMKPREQATVRQKMMPLLPRAAIHLPSRKPPSSVGRFSIS